VFCCKVCCEMKFTNYLGHEENVKNGSKNIVFFFFFFLLLNNNINPYYHSYVFMTDIYLAIRLLQLSLKNMLNYKLRT